MEAPNIVDLKLYEIKDLRKQRNFHPGPGSVLSYYRFIDQVMPLISHLLNQKSVKTGAGQAGDGLTAWILNIFQ